jgi:hypothetical protein
MMIPLKMILSLQGMTSNQREMATMIIRPCRTRKMRKDLHVWSAKMITRNLLKPQTFQMR